MYRDKRFQFVRRRAKYKNVPQDEGGYTYHSKKEAKYARDLDIRLRAGEIAKWERQVKVELFGEHGSHICDYHVDFCITHNDGHLEYAEVKGFETRDWKIKWRLFEDKMSGCPNVELTVIR